MSKLHLTTIILLLTLGLTACTTNPVGTVQSETTAAGDTPLPLNDGLTLLERPCNVYLPKGEVEGETILCGYVRMPWDREDPNSATTDLAYVILKATGGNPQPDAIVHISGGPGIGATLRDVVPELVKRYAPLRSDHDVVLYDQRGMGHSQPFFECPYPDEAQAAKLRDQLVASATGEVSEADIQHAFCQQELAASGFPAAGISTANSAADLIDVMAALGYPAYNLYAISYGTRLAMSLMHYFPDHPLVRSIVLDSAYPLPEDKVNDYLAAPYLYQQALFEAVFQTCAGDLACAAAYPDLRKRYDDLAATLAASPLDLGDGEDFGSDDLYRLVYPFNMALNYIAYQPRLIAELEQGDTTTLTLLRSGQVPTRDVVTGVGPTVDGFSDLMDAFLECTADVTDGDAMEMTLVALWDADSDAVQRAVSELCPGDRAMAVNELLATLAPQAFNGIIARFAPETVQGVNSAVNNKLSCTEQYPFAEELDDDSGQSCWPAVCLSSSWKKRWKR